MDQQILQGRRIRGFAANTDFRTSLTFGRLFALKTKHGMPPWYIKFIVRNIVILIKPGCWIIE
jgi:hypothetical protein